MILIRILSIFILFFTPIAVVAEVENSKAPSLFDTEFGNEPTYIKSGSLTLKQNERVFSYSKHVEMLQGDMLLTSELLDGAYNQDNQIQSMVASKNVVITKGENIRATGERAHFESDKETMTLTGSPELIQGESVLTADTVIIYLAEDRSEALGNVKVRIKDSPKKKSVEQHAITRPGVVDLPSSTLQN